MAVRKREVAVRTAVRFCVRACENQENEAVAAPTAANVSFWRVAKQKNL